VQQLSNEEELMKSLICAASMMSLLVFIGIVSRTSGAAADDAASIDKIMEALHKGRRSPLATLKTALKGQSPDWAAVQKQSKTYVKYAVDLPKNDPPKGDAASFKKLATAFANNAKALNTAAEKEDLGASRAALGKIGGSCKSCHDAHKED
jgi:cytochrome c556